MCTCLASARSRGHRVSVNLIGTAGAPLLTNKRPINSNDTFACKAFQRFGENQISRAFSFFEIYNPEVCPSFALLNCHDSVILNLRLQVPIGGRFLPKGVNLRFTTFFDYLRKARRFHFEELHTRSTRPAVTPSRKKPARELRQGGSDYRCCIPALAGFVSPQSIAPDGKGISRNIDIMQPRMLSGKRSGALTSHNAYVCIDAVKWLSLLLLVVLFGAANSCTTLVNRRDLYSPELAPDSLEATR